MPLGRLGAHHSPLVGSRAAARQALDLTARCETRVAAGCGAGQDLVVARLRAMIGHSGRFCLVFRDRQRKNRRPRQSFGGLEPRNSYHTDAPDQLSPVLALFGPN
jgi:hypothetical protein